MRAEGAAARRTAIDPRVAAGTAIAMAIAAALGGCARSGPPRIRLDTPCAACGMSISDRRFACERVVAGRARAYDSIECLLREAAEGAGPGAGATWLADYDQAALHAADSMWVVCGAFPSPMGGGYAAFLDRAAADHVAARTRGRVGRFADSSAGARP
jgi:nitrous oxide reductase accessory protein NosL